MSDVDQAGVTVETTADTNLALLAGVPIFRGLTGPQLSAIVAKTRKAFFQAGEPILVAGERGDTAYLILSGEADAGGEAAGAGVMVGELAMLAECTYSMDITATDRVRALAIERDALREVMEADPIIARHLADSLLTRLANLAEELRQVDAQFAVLEASLDEAIAAAG